jgi:hypothetical protein
MDPMPYNHFAFHQLYRVPYVKLDGFESLAQVSRFVAHLHRSYAGVQGLDMRQFALAECPSTHLAYNGPDTVLDQTIAVTVTLEESLAPCLYVKIDYSTIEAGRLVEIVDRIGFYTAPGIRTSTWVEQHKAREIA